MDYMQSNVDALNPQELVVVQFITNLCVNITIVKRCVVRTDLASIYASDMKGHTIPYVNDEAKSAKYISNRVNFIFPRKFSPCIY